MQVCVHCYIIYTFASSVLRVGWESDNLITISMIPRSWLLNYYAPEKEEQNFFEKQLILDMDVRNVQDKCGTFLLYQKVRTFSKNYEAIMTQMSPRMGSYWPIWENVKDQNK